MTESPKEIERAFYVLELKTGIFLLLACAAALGHGVRCTSVSLHRHFAFCARASRPFVLLLAVLRFWAAKPAQIFFSLFTENAVRVIAIELRKIGTSLIA